MSLPPVQHQRVNIAVDSSSLEVGGVKYEVFLVDDVTGTKTSLSPHDRATLQAVQTVFQRVMQTNGPIEKLDLHINAHASGAIDLRTTKVSYTRAGAPAVEQLCAPADAAPLVRIHETIGIHQALKLEKTRVGSPLEDVAKDGNCAAHAAVIAFGRMDPPPVVIPDHAALRKKVSDACKTPDAPIRGKLLWQDDELLVKILVAFQDAEGAPAASSSFLPVAMKPRLNALRDASDLLAIPTTDDQKKALLTLYSEYIELDGVWLDPAFFMLLSEIHNKQVVIIADGPKDQAGQPKDKACPYVFREVFLRNEMLNPKQSIVIHFGDQHYQAFKTNETPKLLRQMVLKYEREGLDTFCKEVQNTSDLAVRQAALKRLKEQYPISYQAVIQYLCEQTGQIRLLLVGGRPSFAGGIEEKIANDTLKPWPFLSSSDNISDFMDERGYLNDDSQPDLRPDWEWDRDTGRIKKI